MAVTMYQGTDYHAIECSDKSLAVSPDKQGTGMGSEMIRKSILLAKIWGMKAIRLFAPVNVPAAAAYYVNAPSSGKELFRD